MSGVKFMSEKGRILKNTVIYAIRQVMAVLFPLITFAYVSRVLGVENIGIVNYTHSIATYFVILSGLGISTYAIRIGAQKRDNPDELNSFVSELLAINFISTALSIVAYVAIVFSVESLKEYRGLLIVFSLLIPFTTLGIEWVYNIFEDFIYITIRSIIIQLISFVSLFVFVRDFEDVFAYACITVFATVGSCVLNFVHARKYIKIKSVKLGKNLIRHISPVIMLFGMTIATTLYTNMDTTMLGVYCGDYQVGLYSAAHRVTKIIVQTIAVVRVVSLPALARHANDENSHEKNSFVNLGSEILGAVLLISIPVSIAVACGSDAILTVFSGAAFLEASPTLRLLSIDILLSVLSGILIYQYVLLKMGEKSAFLITVMGALANLFLNYFFINTFQANGAAFATCVSEFIVSACAFFMAKRYIALNVVGKQTLYGCIGGLIIVLFSILGRTAFGGSVVSVLGSLFLGGVLFVVLMIRIKNNIVYESMISLMKKFRK